MFNDLDLNDLQRSVVLGYTVVLIIRALGGRKPNAVVTEIELGVETTEEDITKDPEWVLGKIERHKTTQAHRLSGLLHLHT